MKKILIANLYILLLTMPCMAQKNKDMVRIITLDPGHFHAALVQKTMYRGVDPVVHVFAPPGPDVHLHLDRINAFNTRSENPTHWKEEIYTGTDFFEKMLAHKVGNVVVLSGNNEKKTEYIAASLKAGLNVLADKPMAINSDDFEILTAAFQTARNKNLQLYDIMTERFEITSMLERELSMNKDVFGTLQKGTLADPAVIKDGIHYLYKYVSGNVLKRPAWFMDAKQQGDGIVDVTTHLVDLVQWECFPGMILDYTKDVEVVSAKRWATEINLNEFTGITGINDFPAYLQQNITGDGTLKIYSNGEIHYKLRGIHAKVSVTWAYKPPEGGGDTHYSIMRGTKANLVIRQGAQQNYKTALYIEPLVNDASYENILKSQVKKLQAKYPGVSLKKNTKGWELIIPDEYREDHEAHFARVMKNFLEYMDKGNMPAWEVPGMLAKYYTTTKALEIALKESHEKNNNHSFPRHHP